jgi:hypothetical protein
MFTDDEILALKAALPSYGVKEINKMTGISIPTVYKFLQLKNVKDDTAERIWESGWKSAKMYRDKTERLKSMQLV